ncbi:hypothetical protein HYC85_029230 [Camellia sinensis]|uniref:Retrotransposon gag domain-containing protein n=1 Tax=Camellia sinensis TaxID=4442 RepID=A0A7J7FXM9_CAMSI|nr:hypothetical protein HYC85_029230 [Camellia sinensis]
MVALAKSFLIFGHLSSQLPDDKDYKLTSFAENLVACRHPIFDRPQDLDVTGMPYGASPHTTGSGWRPPDGHMQPLFLAGFMPPCMLIKNRDTSRVQTVVTLNEQNGTNPPGAFGGRPQFLATLLGTLESLTRTRDILIIASNLVDIPQALWIRGCRLHRFEDLIEGQPVYHSLPPVTKRKATRQRTPVQQLVQRASSTPPVYSRDQDPVSPTERERIPVIQPEQNSMASLEEMVRQLQESMKMMQQDAARQAEFARQQATVMSEQADLIGRLQQQTGATPSQQIPPPLRVPIPEETPNARNVQEDTDIPTGPTPPPIPPQQSKAPTHINLSDSPFESEVDPMTLKMHKLEKLFKKSQGAMSVPDIGDGYIDTAVTLPDRFKMPQIDRFDGSEDPMVHLRLFSDVLRPMGLTRLQKLSLFGRTLSGVAAAWYAKLEDDVKRNWDEMAEAFILQYSYNTQIEITTRDLETTRQEPKESFSEFVTRWRAKASMMTLRPTDKDQIRMIVRNLQPKLMQKMIVVPFPTFADLHEMGVQIEDALRQGWIDNDREQPRRNFNRNTNAGPSGATTARTSEVSMVTTNPSPRNTVATPFFGASGSNSQTAKYPPRNTRTFAPLYMPLSKALGVLIRKGHLKPLEPRPLPERLPATHNPAKYCAFHQQHGHDTDLCFRLRHEIQDLIDNGVILPPEKPNVTTNPLPTHNQVPPPKRINFIHTGVASYDPSIYITPSYLPKPKVFLLDCTDLCMMDVSITQPKLVVMTIENRKEVVKPESAESENDVGNAYSPSDYISPVGQNRPDVEFPVGGELCVIRGDNSGQGTDDLTAVEEDFAKFQFCDNQDLEYSATNWYDNEESAETTGWLDDQPDVIGEFQSEQGPAGVGISTTAGSVEEQNTSPESAGVESFAREWSILSTGISEQSTALTQSEQGRFEDSERIRKAKGHVGVETATSAEMKNAASIGIKGTASIGTVVPEPDRCLSAADGMWWEDDDLCLAHTDEDWKGNQPDDTWYIGEVDHITRSGRYFKPPHLDQPETSRKDNEAEKQKEKQLEDEAVLRQLKKIQADISIWGLLMAS